MIKKRPRKKYTQEEVDSYEIVDYPVSKKFKDLTGEVFGKWEVLKYAGKEGSIHAKWFCLCTGCDEGPIQKVLGNHLKKGVTTSCGCEHAIKVSEMMSSTWEEKQAYLNSWQKQWVLVDYKKREGVSNLFIFDCPACNTERASIAHSGVALKSGGCRCTMLNRNGYDYNEPAWFYIMKYHRGEDFYWKYGVTQRSTVDQRDHIPVQGVTRDIFFSVVIRDRWDTISLESDFKDFFTNKGKACTTKGEILGNGNTECFYAPEITGEDMVDFFWTLSPKVIPFTTNDIKDITYNNTISTSSGAIKYFNLDKHERNKWYSWLKKQNMRPRDVDLDNPEHFNKISDEFLPTIRPLE